MTSVTGRKARLAAGLSPRNQRQGSRKDRSMEDWFEDEIIVSIRKYFN